MEPNVLVGKRGRTLSLSPRLQVRMDIVGGHTQSDLRLFIPRYKREKGIVMYVDVVFPGYVPPFNLALTEDVGFYIKAQEDLLSMHFDILVPGHVRPGNKSDVRRNLEYTKDLLDAARAGLVSTTNERLNNAGISKYTDPNAVEFGNYMFAFAILRKLQLDTCYRIMLEKWGCRLGGVDFSTRGHCLTAINYVTLEL